MNRLISLFFIVLISIAGHSADLKIETEVDAFTKETYIRSGNLKLCQPKSAGGMAPCAGLVLVWSDSAPEHIAVRFTVPGVQSIASIATNIAGEIVQHPAIGPATNVEFDFALALRSIAVGTSSDNVFLFRVEDLEAIAASPENGRIRVTGVNASTDFDFYRRSGFGKKVPADDLRQFIEYGRANSF